MRMLKDVQYAIALLNSVKDGEGKPVRLCDVARDKTLSLNFLEQVGLKLKSAGFTTSVRGPGGGYILNRNDISLREVSEAVNRKKSYDLIPECVNHQENMMLQLGSIRII